MNAPSPGAPAAWHLGRVDLAPPQGFASERVTALHQFVTVEEMPLDPQWQKSEEDRAWQRRLEEISERVHPETPVIVSEQALPSGGRLRLLRYLLPGDPEWVTWGGLLLHPGVAVWLTSDGYVENAEKIRALVEERADAWRPLPRGDADPAGGSQPPGSFRTALGYFPSPPADAEEIYARFKRADGAAQLEVRTQRVVEPAPLPFKPISELSQMAGPMGISVTELRDGAREAAGVQGREQVVVMREEGEERFLARFFFPGEAGSPTRPSVSIDLELPGRDADSGLATWDLLLASLAFRER